MAEEKTTKQSLVMKKDKPKKMDQKLAHHYLQLAVYDEKKQDKVERDFWPKIKKWIGKIPFADDLLAAYFCAMDDKTPTKVRGVLLAAIAYFILPVDFVPDFILGMGFSDDATVLMTAFGLVSQYVKERHLEKAQEHLQIITKSKED